MTNPWEIPDKSADLIGVAGLLYLIYRNRGKLMRRRTIIDMKPAELRAEPESPTSRRRLEGVYDSATRIFLRYAAQYRQSLEWSWWRTTFEG